MGWRERGPSGSSRAHRRAVCCVTALRWRCRPATRSPPDGVLGVDISSYQGKITWSTWTKRDKQFTYVKATEGTGFVNPQFGQQYNGAHAAGMIRGAYHFARPDVSGGAEQAEYFIAHGGGWRADGTTLPGALDIEYNPYGDDLLRQEPGRHDGVDRPTSPARTWRSVKRSALIYTSTAWWKQCTGNSGGSAPRTRCGSPATAHETGELPEGWTYATFWQYSSNPIDQDVFSNKLKRLRVLATKA